MCESVVSHWFEGDSFICFMESFAPDYGAPMHSHRLPYCTLLLAGGYDETAPNYSERLCGGSISMHPADERHAKQMAPIWSSEFYVMFRDQELGKTITEREAKRDPIVERLMTRALVAAATDEPEKADIIEACIYEMTTLANHAEKAKTPKWLRNAVDYLLGHANRTVGLEELSREVNIDRSHLARTFRKRYGLTPGDFQRCIRLNKAFRAIITSDAQIGEIAAVTGFSDNSHLSRTLRRTYGRSPQSLREIKPL